MCFSAEASFVASGGLFAAGIYTVHKALQSRDKSFIPLALVPWLFALQQLAEGFVWIFMESGNALAMRTFSFIFLFFAMFFWPFWVPFALAVFDLPRRIMFTVLTFIGVVLGLILYVPYLADPEMLSLRIVNYSICYCAVKPWFSMATAIAYLILTVGSLLLASYDQIKILGIIIGFTAIISYYFYTVAFISVWCFFSAIVSIYIAYIAYRVEKRA